MITLLHTSFSVFTVTYNWIKVYLYCWLSSVSLSCWFTSDRNTIGLINDHHIFILVQHASVEVFGQHVRMDLLQLQTEPFQLRHPLLLSGHRRLRRRWPLPLLLNLPGQIDGSQPGLLSRVGARSLFGCGGLTPAEGRCCPRSPPAVCPLCDPREDGVQTGAPVTTHKFSTTVHCGVSDRS